jgi:hypothetical protein
MWMWMTKKKRGREREGEKYYFPDSVSFRFHKDVCSFLSDPSIIIYLCFLSANMLVSSSYHIQNLDM